MEQQSLAKLKTQIEAYPQFPDDKRFLPFAPWRTGTPGGSPGSATDPGPLNVKQTT